MKHFLLFLSLLAVVAGCILLLPLLAWASLQYPGLGRADYHAAVFSTLLGAPATAAGAATVVLGLATALYAVFLAGNDRHERKTALPHFWACLGVGCVAVFAMLVFVNHLGVQAGRVEPIWRWVCR